LQPQACGGWGNARGRETLTTRFRALAAKVARARHMLTEAQRAALEKAKGDTEAQGEVERACPG
jgi:hypothetical protein